jgi:hypothetical protein
MAVPGVDYFSAYSVTDLTAQAAAFERFLHVVTSTHGGFDALFRVYAP